MESEILTKMAKMMYLTYLTEPDILFRCPLGDEKRPLRSSLKDYEVKPREVQLESLLVEDA